MDDDNETVIAVLATVDCGRPLHPARRAGQLNPPTTLSSHTTSSFLCYATSTAEALRSTPDVQHTGSRSGRVGQVCKTAGRPTRNGSPIGGEATR